MRAGSLALGDEPAMRAERVRSVRSLCGPGIDPPDRGPLEHSKTLAIVDQGIRTKAAGSARPRGETDVARGQVGTACSVRRAACAVPLGRLPAQTSVLRAQISHGRVAVG